MKEFEFLCTPVLSALAYGACMHILALYHFLRCVIPYFYTGTCRGLFLSLETPSLSLKHATLFLSYLSSLSLSSAPPKKHISLQKYNLSFFHFDRANHCDEFLILEFFPWTHCFKNCNFTFTWMNYSLKYWMKNWKIQNTTDTLPDYLKSLSTFCGQMWLWLWFHAVNIIKNSMKHYNQLFSLWTE